MADQSTPIKNTAFTLYFTLYKNDGTVIANPGTYTKKIIKDGGSVADCSNSVTEMDTTYGALSLVLSATEMNADLVWVQIKDDTTGCVPFTCVFYPQPAANVYQTGDSYARLGAPAGASIAADLVTIDNFVDDLEGRLTSTRAGYLDNLDAAISTRLATAGYTAPPTAAAVADAVWDEDITTHTTASSSGLLLQDIDNEVDDIHTVVHSIAVTGSALNKEASAFTKTVGGTEANTYTSTAVANGVTHDIPDVTGQIDVYYEFDVGAKGSPVTVDLTGRLQQSVPTSGNSLDLYAYNWGGSTWELLQSAILAPQTATTNVSHSDTLLSRHVGTGGNAGLVRIRLYNTGLKSGGSTLKVDQVLVSYAEALSGDIALILADTNELQTDITNGGRVDLLIDGIKAKTDSLTFTTANKVDARTFTNDDKTGYSLTVTPPTAAAVADAVWDEAMADHITGGTTGYHLDSAEAHALAGNAHAHNADLATVAATLRTNLGLASANLDTQFSAIPTAAANADAVWDEALAGHATGGSTGAALSAAGAAGDPWSTSLPGAYGAGTAGKILGDNLNAPVATIDTVVDAIKVKTDNLPSDPADQSAVEAAITAATSPLATAAALDAVDNYVDTEVAAIKAKTDQLTFTTANKVDARAFTVDDKTGYSLTTTPPTAAEVRTEMDTNSTKLANLDATVSSRLASASYTTPPTTAEVADAVLDEVVSGHAGAGSVGAVLSSTSTSSGTASTKATEAVEILVAETHTDPGTGVMTIKTSGGATAYTADVYEDVAGTVPYDGTGPINRRDRLTPP